jgi:hypothetical protein
MITFCEGISALSEARLRMPSAEMPNMAPNSPLISWPDHLDGVSIDVAPSLGITVLA